MSLHARGQHAPRPLRILGDVGDARDFEVAGRVEKRIKLFNFLHCAKKTRKAKRVSFFELKRWLRGGGNFEQTCFYIPKKYNTSPSYAKTKRIFHVLPIDLPWDDSYLLTSNSSQLKMDFETILSFGDCLFSEPFAVSGKVNSWQTMKDPRSHWWTKIPWRLK